MLAGISLRGRKSHDVARAFGGYVVLGTGGSQLSVVSSRGNCNFAWGVELDCAEYSRHAG